MGSAEGRRDMTGRDNPREVKAHTPAIRNLPIGISVGNEHNIFYSVPSGRSAGAVGEAATDIGFLEKPSMTNAHWFPPVLFWILVVAAPHSHPQQVVRGAYTIELSGPVDDEARAEAREGALRNLTIDILAWLRERYQHSCDTSNAIDRIHLESFARSCASNVKARSAFEGAEWTLSYQFSTLQLDSLVNTWNSLYDTLALEAYRELAETVARGDRRPAYVQGVQTVFYAKAHIGPPLNVPGEPAMDLIEAARGDLRTALAEMVVSTSGMVISGKPGSLPRNNLTLQIKLDTVPLPGVAVAAFLPSGRKLLGGRTDSEGTLSFARMRLPYVANGTFLYARPNPGAVVDTSYFFTFKEMGLRLSRNPEQTLMFKLTRPTFSLKYRAGKVNNLDIQIGRASCRERVCHRV